MYCNKCGKELKENDMYCSNCGNNLVNTNNANVYGNPAIDKSIESKRTASIVLGIISLVLVFLFIPAPIALILSIIGLILAIKANKKTPNTPGIVLNAISLFLSIICMGIIIIAILLAANVIKNAPTDYGNIIDEYLEKTEQNF